MVINAIGLWQHNMYYEQFHPREREGGGGREGGREGRERGGEGRERERESHLQINGVSYTASEGLKKIIMLDTQFP